jgi:hypothetical protein
MVGSLLACGWPSPWHTLQGRHGHLRHHVVRPQGETGLPFYSNNNLTPNSILLIFEGKAMRRRRRITPRKNGFGESRYRLPLSSFTCWRLSVCFNFHGDDPDPAFRHHYFYTTVGTFCKLHIIEFLPVQRADNGPRIEHHGGSKFPTLATFSSAPPLSTSELVRLFFSAG